MSKKWLPWLVGMTVVVGLAGWGVRSLTNLPGEAVDDMGRDHYSREELAKITYNSNPPISGPHDPDWIRPGMYEVPQDKYQLIHSLEHGYIVVHYNCALPISNNDEATPSASQEVDCELAQTLIDFKNNLGLERVIINPNPELDKPVVLTAWGRILKLDHWDSKAATRFAKAYHNRGPEQTRE